MQKTLVCDMPQKYDSYCPDMFFFPYLFRMFSVMFPYVCSYLFRMCVRIVSGLVFRICLYFSKFVFVYILHVLVFVRILFAFYPYVSVCCLYVLVFVLYLFRCFSVYVPYMCRICVVFFVCILHVVPYFRFVFYRMFVRICILLCFPLRRGEIRFVIVEMSITS
jgi:hypothetical protein